MLVNYVARDSSRDDVAKMRERMRNELSRGRGDRFDLKQDPGGLADIEFLIDYWVLANAGRSPELAEYPDNIRQLEALEHAGLVSAEDCRGLREAYLTLRRRTHDLALAEEDRVVDGGRVRCSARMGARALEGRFRIRGCKLRADAFCLYNDDPISPAEIVRCDNGRARLKRISMQPTP